MRRDLIRKILAVPLRQLEELGAPRLMVALTEDIMFITQALMGIPSFAVNLAILLGGAAYLGWLSGRVLLVMSGLMLFGALGYRLLINGGFTFLSRAREEEDKMGAHAWSQLLYCALIGLILFLLPRLQPITTQALTGYVVTMLYLMGPLAGVLGSLSVFSRADVSLCKIEKLGLSLAQRCREEFPLAAPERETRLQRLELLGVTHSYHHEKDDNHFTLGPIHTVFEPGELVFLVGGNGSGKSTLAKLISGLYPPETGEIRLNRKPIRDQNRDDYRQHFSAVFSDFFVFENLLGLEHANLDAQAQDYLVQLHLDHKVKVRDGVLSTTALSQGQRKRLALLTAYLEDRPFYLFDEWASDQDPQFKEIFYTQLLPELKARGKAILVITHDEKHFRLGDRIIKLDYGKVVYEKRIRPASLEPALQV